MSRRLAAVCALLAGPASLAACHYGDDSVVPPRGGWPSDAAVVDATSEAGAEAGLPDAAGEAGDALDAAFDADAADARDAPVDASACGVVVNEVMMRGAAGDDELVELFNGCAAPFTFPAGWTIATPTNGGFGAANVVDLAGKTITGGGYLLFVGNGYAGAAEPDGLLSDGTDQLSGAGGAVALMNGSAPVDRVGWGALTRAEFREGSATVVAPANGKSIARLPNGADTNVNVADFATDRPPSPGAPNP